MGKGSQPAACDAGLAPAGVLSTYAVEKFRGYVVGCQGNVRRCQAMSVGVCGIKGSGVVEHCRQEALGECTIRAATPMQAKNKNRKICQDCQALSPNEFKTWIGTCALIPKAHRLRPAP